MLIGNTEYNHFLEQAAENLDISPTKYKQAVSRYEAVGNWLDSGDYGTDVGELKIYPQGSFRLGTVIRPYRNQSDQDYDIDLVCELVVLGAVPSPDEIKKMIGNRLKENETYYSMLDKEGKRCWTLNYSEQDGVGFHLDVLPAIPDQALLSFTCIAITNKDGFAYTWCSSDPKGYAEWFEARNKQAFQKSSLNQKRSIALNFQDVFASIEEVPDMLVRTPLQRAIQILKRHRDVRFCEREDWKYAPISMIITTIAAHLYNNEQDVLTAVTNIINNLDAHNALLINRKIINAELAAKNLIVRNTDGTWYIANPTNPEENFADKWHEDNHARAKSFFQWVAWLKEDFIQARESGNDLLIRHMNNIFGTGLVSRLLLSEPTKIVQPLPRKVQIGNAPKPWRRG